MTDFYPIIAKVTYYDINNSLRTTYHPLYAASLADAVKIIEQYYGQELDAVAVQYADIENTLFEISESLANYYCKEGAFL